MKQDCLSLIPKKELPLKSAIMQFYDFLNGIFDNRFKYVDELARMGANIKVEGNTAIISGVDKYSGASITAPDLRAGAALVIAALVADGESVVDDITYIERGYEDFDQKLAGLGANIVRVASERELKMSRLKLVE